MIAAAVLALILLLLGVAGTVYDVVAMRTYEILYDMYGSHDKPYSGEMNYAAREAYSFIDSCLPKDVIVQHNPNVYLERYHSLYCNRQAVVSDELNGSTLGVAESSFQLYQEQVSALFARRSALVRDIEATAWVRLSIHYMVISSEDPIKSVIGSSHVSVMPLYSNVHFRVFNTTNSQTNYPLRRRSP